MHTQDLDDFMKNVRNELTRITLDLAQLTQDNADLHFALQMRQTHLLTQLQHTETIRWFSPPNLDQEAAVLNPSKS